MTRFSDDWKSSANDMAENAFGETVSYTAYGQAAANITARVTYDVINMENYSDGEIIIRQARVRCNPADVTSPSVKDKFTISSRIWAVRAVTPLAHVVEFEIQAFEQKTGSKNPLRDSR